MHIVHIVYEQVEVLDREEAPSIGTVNPLDGRRLYPKNVSKCIQI